jgi:hypothetical protein
MKKHPPTLVACKQPRLRPISSSNPRPVGCYSPQAVHHGFAVAVQSWRVVAALRSRPTRRQCTIGQSVRHKSRRVVASLRSRPTRRQCTIGSQARYKSWRYAAAPCREGLEATSLPRSIFSQPPRLCSCPYLVLKVLTIYLNFTFAHNPELVSSFSSVRGARPCAQNCCKQPENRTLHVRIRPVRSTNHRGPRPAVP